LLGDFVNGLITPRIYASSGNNLGAPYMMGFVFHFMTLLMVIALCCFDKHVEQKDKVTLKHFKKEKRKLMG